MRKAGNTYCNSYKSQNRDLVKVILFLLVGMLVSGCDLIKIKGENSDTDERREPAARANNSYLYKDELMNIVAAGTPAEDSAKLVEAYINSWIRKQLLIQRSEE